MVGLLISVVVFEENTKMIEANEVLLSTSLITCLKSTMFHFRSRN